MAKDIDVDEQDLREFIAALRSFQDRISDKFKTLDRSWQQLDDSWKGPRKERFSKDFEGTLLEIKNNLKHGDETLEWLLKYQQAVNDLTM